MVKIGEYRNWEIRYEDGMFSAYKENNKHDASIDREKSLKDSIDAMLEGKARKKAEFEAKEQKEKELKEKKENLKKENSELCNTKIIADMQDFKNFIRKLKLYHSEPIIEAKLEKMQCTLLDPANCLLSHGEIPIKKIETDFKFCINAENIWRIIKDTNAKIVTLTFEPRSDLIALIISSDDGGGYIDTIEFVENESRSNIPDLNYSVKFNISTEMFYHEIEKIRSIENSMGIEVTKNQMLKISVDDDRFGYRNNLMKVKGKAKSRFSKDYLQIRDEDGFMYFSDSKSLKFQIDNDYPIRIEDERGNWIILAPRIEN